jgi:hypothetical protein
MKTKTPTKPRKLTQKKTKAAIPAGMRPHPRPTINAELVDDLFEQTIANMMALQAVWEKTNAEMAGDLFVQTIANLMALQVVWEKISFKKELES